MKNRLRSFVFAARGLAEVWRSQPNMRIHLAAAALAIGLGGWLQLSFSEWCILALAIGAVLAAECFNTALEHLTNLVSPEFHPLAGKAKDAAAAAVLVAAIAAACVGVGLFLPRLWRFLNG